MLNDTAVHRPPTDGPYPYYDTYGAFAPHLPGFPAKGATFTDPIFNEVIRRLTDELDQGSDSEHYSKNGFINADATRMHHRAADESHNIIDTLTGNIIRANAVFNSESSFDPVDPDVWWHFSKGADSPNLTRYLISTGVGTVVKTFPSNIGLNGSSVDWIDNSGDYMVLRIGGFIRLWKKSTDTLYANPLPATYGISPGWFGITPDGNYIVTATNKSGYAELNSWLIDHVAQSVATTSVMFWSMCGAHADLISASNGMNYAIAPACDAPGDAGVYRVDITKPQLHTNKAQQIAQNVRLFPLDVTKDDVHISCVSKGELKDWGFVSIESFDPFGSPVDVWRAYEQEIVMTNVVTLETRRLAHHRSRAPGSNYYFQPKVECSFTGSIVSWCSNMGRNSPAYADIYSIVISADEEGGIVDPPPPPPPDPEPDPEPLPEEGEMLPEVGLARSDYTQTVAGNKDFVGAFKILDADMIEVLKNGVLAVRGVDYDIIGVGNNTFTVRWLIAPLINDAIAILRKERPEQVSDYTMESVPPERIESDFDKAAMRTQQVLEILGRCFKFAKKSLFRNLDADDPVDGFFLYKKPGGGFGWALPASGSGSIPVPLPIAQGGTNGITAAAARTELGVTNDATGRGNVGAAPAIAPYVVISANAEIPNAKVLTAGAGISIADATITASLAANRGYIFGMQFSNAVGDPTNDIVVSAGECTSDDLLGVNRILLSPGLLTKQIDAVWAAGTNAGMRVGALADGTWHTYAFRRSGGTDDIFAEQSLTPTIPDGGTKKRYLFSFRRVGGVIVPMVQDGDLFQLVTSVQDIAPVTNPGAAAVTRTLTSVPTGLKLMALIAINLVISTNASAALISDLEVADEAPNPTNSQVNCSNVNSLNLTARAEVRTNISAQVRTRLSASDAGTILAIRTYGWINNRGRIA